MKYLPLIWAGLWRKPLRTLFTVGALTAAFAVVGLVKGLDRQLDNMMELGKMNKMWVDPRFVDREGGGMPMSHKQQLEALPGVTLVLPQIFISGYIRDPKIRFFAGGADDSVFEFFPHFRPSPEKLEELRQTRNGLLITKNMADVMGIKEGDDVPVRSGAADLVFHLVAVVDRPDIPLSNFSLANYDFINEQRTSNKGTADEFLVIIEDPNKGAETARAIDAMFANSSVPTRTQLDYVRMASRATVFGDVKFFVNAVTGVTLAALLLLTSNTLLQSYRERRAEFGVLKTLGYGDTQLLLFIFVESFAQFAVGAILGLSLANFASGFAAAAKTPLAPLVAVPASVWLSSLAIAAVLSLVNAALPAWRTHQLQVVDALKVQ